MENLWRDDEAEKVVAGYQAKGTGRDLALRTYTTRLLGGEPRLVLHGGGNTSVKTEITDLVGDTHAVLCVKGSGWDMGTIEPPGLPAVKIAPLLKSRKLERLSDEDMVTLLRANLIDPASPNPSVEALLHAFLPHKFVDHTHSTAILAIADQAKSKGGHLTHFELGVAKRLLQCGNRFREAHASERERCTAPGPRFIVIQQTQEVGWRRRRHDRRPSPRGRGENYLRGRIRITNEALILEAQNPSELFFPRDDRRSDRGSGCRRRARARAGEDEEAQG